MKPLQKFKSILLAVAAVVGVWTAGPALALPITFNTSDNQFDPGFDNQGWWSAERSNADDNDNYAAGIADFQLVRNFFTFDLAALGGMVTSATLEIQRFDYNGDPEGEIYGLFDVSTDAETLNNNVGVSAAIFDDLGTGTSYGEFIVNDGSPLDLLSFTLNAAAIADINAAAGDFFSIGGALLEGDVGFLDSDGLFFDSQLGGIQRLVVNVEERVAVPEPGTLVLVGAALAGLGLVRKRRVLYRYKT